MIFEVYQSVLIHADKKEFNDFDEFSLECFYRLKFRSIEGRISQDGL